MAEAAEYLNLVDGKWTAGPSPIANINPSQFDEIIGVCHRSDEAIVSDAIAAARAAFPAWRDSSPQTRFDILDRVGDALLRQKDEFGRILAREEGKTLAEAIGEVARAGQIFKFFAGEAVRMTGDVVASTRPGVDVEVFREPVGVIGLITPWNFPIAIPAWKIAPALAFGNTVVIKPAEITPACLDILAKLLVQAGCPNGVFNLVHASGRTVGKILVEHPDIDAISFTGSVPTGRQIVATAAAGFKRVQAELGGKNPMVVMNDCDLDLAVAACINGAFFSTGQRCTASSRLIVEERIHDAFVERMSDAMGRLKTGDALDPHVHIGPVASQAQLKSNSDYLDLALIEGCQLIGGHLVDPGEGFFLAPALMLGANNDMRVSREEIFGPIAAVIKAADFDEALALANDTEFGLASGICTTSLRHAREFKRRSNAGMVMVNLPTAGVDYHVPFGGRCNSSYGPREQGQYAREFYTTVKTGYTFA